MKKKEKEKKGIGCATTLILLPIPGEIIYGLVSETYDFAHSFIYGCFISLARRWDTLFDFDIGRSISV